MQSLRAIALVGACAIFASAANAANAAIQNSSASADVAAPKEDVGIVPAATPAAFRSSTEDYSGRIVGSLGFVLLVALAGFATVYVLKRKINIVNGDGAAKGHGVRLLSFKRMGPRLNVLVIEVGRGKVVTLADNGNSLLKLAEYDQEPAQPTAKAAGERPHEK